MLAEAIIENDEMRIVNFSMAPFISGKHWKVNIEPIEEIIDKVEENDFIFSIVSTPMEVKESVEFLRRDDANER
jgi:restriction endonuclease S subunit